MNKGNTYSISLGDDYISSTNQKKLVITITKNRKKNKNNNALIWDTWLY